MCSDSASATEFRLDSSFSQEAQQRSDGKLARVVLQFHGKPGIIGMHGGLPPASMFPLTSLSFTTLDPAAAAAAVQPPAHPAAAPPMRSDQEIVIDTPADVASLQQYNLDYTGKPALCAWLRGLMVKMHAPPRPDADVIITSGNTLTIDTVFRMLLDPGDVVLVESFMYSQVYEVNMAPRGILAAPVDIDDEGMCPDSLEAAIQNAIATTGRAPKVLYTVPHAHNPTGCSMSMARKRAVYALCRQHNVFILEDDPYIYLQFPETGDDMPERSSGNGRQRRAGLNVDPSFISLDHDGRVLRLDTFSKMLAPGLRLGWATAAPSVLNALKPALMGAAFGPCGVSQGIALALLTRWGLPGFEAHLRGLQRGYCSKARTLAAALREHCGDSVSVRWPSGGMFLWVTVPAVADTEDLMDLMVSHKVVALPGRYFSPRCADPTFKCRSLRMAFSMLSDDQLHEGARRFGALLRAFTARPADLPASAVMHASSADPPAAVSALAS